MQSLSIIVPVYNSEKYLDTFINSFLKQTDSGNNYELVFVDNGSTDDSKLMIEGFIEQYNNYDIKYFYYDQISDSYAARNYGVKNTNGEVLVFTDSDCILEPNYIENIYKIVKKGSIISGEVEIQIINSKNLWEVFDSFAHLNNKKNAPKGKVATANLVVTREDFMKIGFFEERFSGGDHDWSLRAKNMGFEIIYKEEIKVLHPSRKKFSQIIGKNKRIAYGAGMNHVRKNKKIYTLVILYILKFFNFKTNVRYSKKFMKKGFPLNKIVEFNIYFTRIRLAQLKFAIQGYKQMNARQLNIK